MVFAIRGLKHRKGSFCRKFGPVNLLIVASFCIMAEPSRHVLSDYNIWALCWNNPTDAMGFHNPMVRINQTWNSQCVFSSLEYHCNVPCCVPMADFEEKFPLDGPNPRDDLVKNHVTRNGSVLVLNDTAWNGHFRRWKCNSTDGTDYCPGGGDACHNPDCTKVETYECVCDACVFEETFSFLAPVGIIFTATLTYTGFLLLAVGSLWNADIVAKLKKVATLCKQIKEQKAREKAQGEAGTGKEALLKESAGNDLPVATEAGTGNADGGEEECAT